MDVPFVLLHAGDAIPAGTSHYGLPDFLQSFIDSEMGVAISIGLHTAGVLAFMVGLGFGAFKVWRASSSHPFTREDLRFTQNLTWGGLAANLVGGSMRLAESDHPTLASIGENPWVQIILTKHIIWAFLVGITFLWLHRQLPRMLGPKAVDEAQLESAKKGAYYGVALVLMITLAGAAASAVGPGAHGAMEAPSPAGEMTHLESVNRTVRQFFNGTLTGLPTRPASQEIPVVVPANATRFTAQVTWTDATGNLQLQLLDPTGHATPGTTTGMQSAAEAKSPLSGTWRIIVSSQQGVQIDYKGSFQVDYVEQVVTTEVTQA